MKHPSMAERLRLLARSAGVGALATLCDLVVLAALVHGAGLLPRAASPLALVSGVLIQFVGNKVLAFRDRSPRWAAQGARFLMVEAIGFGLNLWLFDLAMRLTHLPMLPVRLLIQSAVYFGVCLPLWSRIFRPAALEASR